MAKKKKVAARKPRPAVKPPKLPARDKQTRIPGTFDPVPKAVQKSVDAYVDALRARQSMQAKENEHRAATIELMNAHSLRFVELDEERVLVLETPDKESLKIKRKDKASD